jgi:hypothetical protein
VQLALEVQSGSSALVPGVRLMKIRIGSWPNWDEVDIRPGEEISFDELPGAPKLMVDHDGSVTWRLSHAQLVVVPQASNSIVLKADE